MNGFACRIGNKHDYDIVEDPMADDEECIKILCSNSSIKKPRF